jgi:hypothetical protein
MDKIIMSYKEIEQVQIFEKLKRREITQQAAAQILGLSDRQIRNKLKRFIFEGPVGLIHKNRGRKGYSKFDQQESFINEILLNDDWKDFGPTFASEKLAELYDIEISREALRQKMKILGLWNARSRKKQFRQRRERKRMFGMMIQVDGSPHKWLGDEKEYTLLVFIDDATSKITWLQLAESESTEALMLASKKYVEKYGRPVSIYVDYGSVFSVNVNNPEREKLTQYGRAMKELQIDVIHARSPQAKGRVERSNRTLQDRLIKEMRLANIRTPEEANNFLPSYIEKHNNKYAVKPLEEGDAHKSILNYNLEMIFTIREERKLQNDYTILYKSRIFQLLDQQTIRYRPKDAITVNEHLNGSITLSLRGFKLRYKELDARPRKHPEEKVYIYKPRRISQSSRNWNSGNKHYSNNMHKNLQAKESIL